MTRFSVFIVLGVVSVLLLIHEAVYQGNQGKLFFPGLQRSSAFKAITGVPYSGEEVQYFEYGQDWDADSHYYLVAQVSEATLHQIITKRNLIEQPFTTDTLRWWRFPKLRAPTNPVYYTTTFPRKGSVHLWHDKEHNIFYLVDVRPRERIG